MQHLSLINKKGFTLVEVLVVVAITALIGAAVNELFTTTWRTYHTTNGGLNAEQEARVAMEKIAKDLRQATTVSSISAQAITFYRYYDNDTVSTKIQITLSGKIITYTKTLPSGTYPNVTYPTSNATTSIIASHIENNATALFVPYNDSNQSLSYSDIGSLRMIKITIIDDNNPLKNPPAVRLDSGVELRNFKTN